MKIIKAKALTGSTDIVDPSSKELGLSVELLTSLDLALRTITRDVVCDGYRDLELVGVRVGLMGLLELHNMP